ncbi:MAG: caspase family protein [Polyangiaceae bacterium]|nr:caspase family protein [Polyangiaceae bacterium]
MSARWLFALVVGWSVLGLTLRADASGLTRALVIGSNLGLAEDPPLRFAEADATELARTLVQVGAVAQARLRLLRGPGLADAERAMSDLARDAGPTDLVLVFFSGHGSTAGAHLAGRVWPWARIRSELALLPARVVVAFFDACSSGVLVATKGGIVRGPPLQVATEPLSPSGRFLVTSSGAQELAYESILLRASPFSLALRSGLRGAADANQDQRITLGELYAFVYGRTLAATLTAPAGPQHPVRWVELRGAGDLVLVERLGAGRIRRASTARGTCYVLDPAEVRVLGELSARPGAEIALPRGHYVVKCLPGAGLEVASVRVAEKPVVLEAAKFESAPRTYALAKGAEQVMVHRLDAGLVGLSLVARDLGSALSLGYRFEKSDLSLEPRAILTLPAPNRALLWSVGLGGRLPWWQAWDTRLRVGLEVGLRTDAPGARATGQGPGPAPFLGSFVAVDRPLTGRVAAHVRISFASLYPTSGDFAPVGAVLCLAGLSTRLGQEGFW